MFVLRDYQKKIIKDTFQALKTHKAPCVVAPCGAGKSVIIATIIKLFTDKKANVLFLVHVKELQEQIKNTLLAAGVNPNYVNVAMVQTQVRKTSDKTDYKLIVTDENHHSLANSYIKIYERYSNAKRIGFTATPIRLNGGGLGDVNDILIESVNVQWLINNNFLAPFKYLAPSVIDIDKLKVSKGEYSNKSIDSSFKNSILGDVKKIYDKYLKGRKTIVYCHSIEHSEVVANTLGGVTLHSKIDKYKRNRIIDDFRTGKVKVLCNVMVLGEGFDVPDCDAVILLRPTKSLSLFIQQSMRCMRYKPNKEAIIVDMVENYKEHGLPDTPRVWDLETKPKTKKPKVRSQMCVNCLNVAESIKNPCQYCGYVKEIQERKLEVIDEEFEYRDIKKIKLEYIPELSEVKNINDLKKIQKAKKYKNGWVYYQAKLKGYL
ncbi:helicase [Gemella sp. ND 6198]|uniref:DEAD/DEAH box helicase n=1 Tax=Gemella sp. ND 6198 TaxID=2040624 RepID=UPI000E0AA0DB|nr:DEAD/DEAH box helicase [Gemella sp. ND 6198]AXI27281.1 helicase [Gemella sp. ND 6198]